MTQNIFRLALVVAALGTAAACSSGSGGGNTGGAGTSTQKLSIGSACAADADCGGAGFMCMTDHPGGYCVKMCDITSKDADCPSESVCQFDGMAGECHKMCSMMTDCRTGYVCAPAAMDPSNTVSHAFCDMP